MDIDDDVDKPLSLAERVSLKKEMAAKSSMFCYDFNPSLLANSMRFFSRISPRCVVLLLMIAVILNIPNFRACKLETGWLCVFVSNLPLRVSGVKPAATKQSKLNFKPKPKGKDKKKDPWDTGSSEDESDGNIVMSSSGSDDDFKPAKKGDRFFYLVGLGRIFIVLH